MGMSLEQAADLIASRLQVKQADVSPAPSGAAPSPQSAPGFGTGLLKSLGLANIDPSNPLHAALLGGGLGLGAGGLSSLMSDDEDKRKNWLSRALSGATMGAMGAGGLSAALGPAGLGGLTKEDPNNPPGPDPKDIKQQPDIFTALSHGVKPITDVLSMPDSGLIHKALKPVDDLSAAFPGSTIAAGGLAGVASVNALNNRNAKQQLPTTLANPDFMKKNIPGVNATLTAGGHSAITPEQLAAISGGAKWPLPGAGLAAAAKDKLSPILEAVKNEFKAPAPRQRPNPNAIPVLRQPPQPATPTPPLKQAIPAVSRPQMQQLLRAQDAFAPTAVKRRRTLGGLLGAGTGVLLNATHAPHLSQNEIEAQSRVRPK